MNSEKEESELKQSSADKTTETNSNPDVVNKSPSDVEGAAKCNSTDESAKSEENVTDKTLVCQDSKADKISEEDPSVPEQKDNATDAKHSPVKESQKKGSDDPYAYVDRNDFTSEKFKIEIRGLPKYYGYGELKKFLNDKLKLASHKVKLTRTKSPWVFVCFKNEEDRQTAIKTLNRLTWKGRMLTASTAKPAPDPLVKKRKLENESGNAEKKPKISDDEMLRNSTTPYWNLSYEEQLQKKYEYVKSIMCNLADLINSVNPMLTKWIRRQKAKYDGMVCQMLDIRKSPICDGYRNKCEFTIGINEETKQRMVGFRLGSYVQGHVGVGPIDSLKHIPQRMKETVKVFEKFVQASSKDPYNPETHTGLWKLLILRLTTLDELMVIVVVNSKGVSRAELDSVQEEVKNFFENGEVKALKVNSLYFQAVGRREPGKEPPMEHLSGATHITESLLGLKFRISPEAFFQVNTPGASVLYSAVGEMINLSKSSTVIDVCCGTGTIGLSLAKKCGKVLSLEVVRAAIEDAKVNADVNNITNCEFFTGRAEEILPYVLSRAKGKSVYAVVDPPRSGLQHKGVIALRSAEVVEQIVYVSCDPNAAVKNFVDLARQTSKTYHGFPLVPVCAVPVDMFPHTAHCEVVILFQRVNPMNLPKSLQASKNDISVLSSSLHDNIPKEPNSNEDGSKDEAGTPRNKERNISNDTPNPKGHRKDISHGKQQSRKLKSKPEVSGRGRMGRFNTPGFSNRRENFISKTGFFQSSEKTRGQKRSFEHDRRIEPDLSAWRDKSPPSWPAEGRRRWKEDESFVKSLPSSRFSDRRLDSERSGMHERRLNPWDERNVRGEELKGELNHDRNERPMREISPGLEWRNTMDERNLNFKEEDIYRMRRNCDINAEGDRPAYRSPVEQIGRKSSEFIRGLEERNMIKNDDCLWKGGPQSVLPKIGGRAMMEEEYSGPLIHHGRSGMMEVSPPERSDKIWMENSRNDSSWHRREDTSARDIDRKMDCWRREDRDQISPKRWRDERDTVIEDEINDRSKFLRREDEEFLMPRRGNITENRYGPFESNEKGDYWPRDNIHNRLGENIATNKPTWVDQGMVEDSSRIGSRRIGSDRSPACERGISPWDDRRIKRDEVEGQMGGGDRFQGVRNERSMRENSPGFQWRDAPVRDRNINLDEEDPYRMRRNRDLYPECDRSAYGSMSERIGGNSSEHTGRMEERSMFDRERGLESKGAFDDQRSSGMFSERERVVPRFEETMDRISSQLIPYRNDQLPPVDYPEKRVMTEFNRRPVSPDTVSDRPEGNRMYRNANPENYRGGGDVSMPHISQGKRLPSDSYTDSKERMNSYEDEYNCNVRQRDYDFMDNQEKMDIRRGEMNQQAIMDDDYRMECRDSRRVIGNSVVLVVNSSGPAHSNPRYTSFEEEVVKNIVLKKDQISPIKTLGLGGIPSGPTKAPSPVHRIENDVNLYPHERSVDNGREIWRREKGRENFDWRDSDKGMAGGGYFGREEPNVPESFHSAPNYKFTDRDDRNKSEMAYSSPYCDTPRISPSNVEKSFSFSMARAAIVQNAYGAEDVKRAPVSQLPGPGLIYQRKAEDQFSMPHNISHNAVVPTDTAVDSVNQRNAFRQPYARENKRFEMQSSPSSIKPAGLKQVGPMLSQISSLAFNQGLTSDIPVSSKWGTTRINPWEGGQPQRW